MCTKIHPTSIGTSIIEDSDVPIAKVGLEINAH